MRVKWKCVWKVLKPKIIATLIVILIFIVCLAIVFLLGNYWISTTIPIYSDTMTIEQQQQMVSVGTTSNFPLSWMIAATMVVGGIICIILLSIELIKSLAEALRPCIIWEGK